MKINWKTRLKNKVTLTALIACVITFVYQVLGIFNVVPAISETDVSQVAGIIINFLVVIGVIADPNTPGVSDSNRAMTYEAPMPDTDDIEELEKDKMWREEFTNNKGEE